MPEPFHRKIRWLIGDLFWNTGRAHGSSWGWLWATWRLIATIVGAALLTWLEWAEHHPPDIAIVALIHFVFVLIAIALIVQIGRWFGRAGKLPDR